MSRDKELIWNRRVARVRRRINTAIWLETACLPLFVGATVLAMGLYMSRRLLASWWMVAAGCGTVILASLAYSWIKSRARLFTDRDARAYLDEQLGLNSALSASREMDVELPDVAGDNGLGCCLRRRSRIPLYWMAASIGMLAFGCLLPLPRETVDIRPPVSLPPSLDQVKNWLDKMEETKEVTPESLEPFREQLGDLMKMSREEMYAHAGLEASDAMRANAENASRDLSHDMMKLEQAMNELSGTMTEDQKAAAMQNLQNALQAMEQSALQPGGDMAQLMTGLNPAQLSQLSREQMEKLREQLKKSCGKVNRMCSQCFGDGKGMMDPDQHMYTYGEGEGKDGTTPGSGGVSRGRGDAPISFQKSEYDSLAGRNEKIKSDDMSHAALGEQVGMQYGSHEVEPDADEGPKMSGAAGSGARGGDSVWKDNLTPQEREALKAVFK